MDHSLNPSVTPERNKPPTAIAPHFFPPEGKRNIANKNDNITNTSQERTPTQSFSTNKKTQTIHSDKPNNNTTEQFKARSKSPQNTPNLEQLDFNAQCIANAFQDNDDTWNFKWIPKDPTYLWHEGPNRYSLDQDLEEFDNEADVYGLWEGSVSHVINQILEGINIKSTEKENLNKKIYMERIIS